MIFRKYEFTSESEAQQYIDALPSETDSEGNTYPTHKHAIVKLGFLWITKPTYDENGDVLTEGVRSTKYSVDMLWDGDALTSWDSKMIWCVPVGVHVFGNQSAISEWNAKCKEIHPEYYPSETE